MASQPAAILELGLALLPREAPSKMGFGVVDAVPIPTPTCPLDAIRARAEL